MTLKDNGQFPTNWITIAF